MTQKNNPQRAIFFVGSTNPVKINSVKLAVQDHWPHAEVMGFEVASGVSPQPFSDAETKQGAANRAGLALQTGLSKLSIKNIKNESENVILGVGLEGGVFDIKNEVGELEMWTTVWVVVIDQKGHTAASCGSRFLVPELVASRIRAGEEMGIAAQKITGIDNVKQNAGLIGIVTDNFTNRTEEYMAIAKMTVGIWYGRHWQKNLGKL